LGGGHYAGLVPVSRTEPAESAGDEIDRVVAEILCTFGLRVPKSTRWGPRLPDLRRVLQADYQASILRFVQEGKLPLEELRTRAEAVFPKAAREFSNRRQ
jgi:hypothetical protein